MNNTITISGDEYYDLVRAATQLDMLLIQHLSNGFADNYLNQAISKERGVVITAQEDKTDA